MGGTVYVNMASVILPAPPSTPDCIPLITTTQDAGLHQAPVEDVREEEQLACCLALLVEDANEPTSGHHYQESYACC